MNSLKKGEGVPLLNIEGGPRILLLNFEGGPGVLLLNFRGVPGPTFKLWGGSRVLGSWSHFYTMPSIYGHLEISASASRHQHRHWNQHWHRHCNFFLPFEVSWEVKHLWWSPFQIHLEAFAGSVRCCLEQLFCRDVFSACFWRKELRHGRYLKSFKNMQGWKLRLVYLCVSDKEPYQRPLPGNFL